MMMNLDNNIELCPSFDLLGNAPLSDLELFATETVDYYYEY